MSLEPRGRKEKEAPPAASLAHVVRVLEETTRVLRAHASAEQARPAAFPEAPSAALIRSIIAARKLRHQYLGVARGDPEWSMILELYAARLEGRRVPQTMLSLAAAVPQTTAIRLTRKLIEEGIFATEPDPKDRRLLLVSLTDGAADRIRAYLAAALAAGPLVP